VPKRPAGHRLNFQLKPAWALSSHVHKRHRLDPVGLHLRAGGSRFHRILIAAAIPAAEAAPPRRPIPAAPLFRAGTKTGREIGRSEHRKASSRCTAAPPSKNVRLSFRHRGSAASRQHPAQLREPALCEGLPTRSRSTSGALCREASPARCLPRARRPKRRAPGTPCR